MKYNSSSRSEMHAVYIFLCLASIVGISAQMNELPRQVSAVKTTAHDGSCPSAMLEAARQNTKQQVGFLLRDQVIPSLRSRPPCACGGRRHWTRMAHLNMSDSTHQCPPNWNLITSPVRGCGRRRLSGGCDSASFPSGGRQYSHVCGRVIAYMSGSPSAFEPSIVRNPGIEGVYLEGVSLTHGPAGSRQHIWSFPTALFENDPNYGGMTAHVCFCTNTNFLWPHQVPSFVNNDYFCDTANPGPAWIDEV